MSNDCPYCHTYKTSHQKTFGKDLRLFVPWWNHYQNRWSRRVVWINIASPENRHPKLCGNLLVKPDIEHLFELSIHACPICGRKIGDAHYEFPPAQLCSAHHGKHANTKIEYWDWIRKTKIRKKVVTKFVTNPKTQQTVLRVTVDFRNNPTTRFDFKLNYCPYCAADLKPQQLNNKN